MNYKINADRFVKVVDRMLKSSYGELTALPPEKTNEQFNQYLRKVYGDGQKEYIKPEDLEGELYFIPIHSDKLDDDHYPYSYVPSAKILFLNWTRDAMWDISEMLNMNTLELFKLYFKTKFGFDVQTISFADKRID
jgi:hypothetical protein